MLWCIFTGDLRQHALEHNSNEVLYQHELGRCKAIFCLCSKYLSPHLTEQWMTKQSKMISVCDLRGCEQDDVEGLDHGRGKAQVPFLIQYVSQSTENFLWSQQEGQLAQYEGAPPLQQSPSQWTSKPATAQLLQLSALV